MEITTSKKITTFLMFEGSAEEAMNFYLSLFGDGEIISITRYGADGPGKDGSVQHATFALGGEQFMCVDSPANHDTPRGMNRDSLPQPGSLRLSPGFRCGAVH